MNRNEIQEEILSIKNRSLLLELPTGFGKSKLALDWVQENCNADNILIVINRKVHIKNWKDEIDLWWNTDVGTNIKFTTYASLHKHAGYYSVIIFDECHHITERCLEILKGYKADNYVLLSATVSKKQKQIFNRVFPELYIYSKTLRNAIEEEVLPDPTIYLIPLELDNIEQTEKLVYNPKGKGLVYCNFVDRWKVRKDPKYRNHVIHVRCTKRQYLNEMNSQIDYWKRRYMSTRSDIAKNKWMRLCSDRLKWLSDKKEYLIYKLLSATKDNRTLTFCNSIEQTEKFGRNHINSKNEDSAKHLENFNNGVINHITACNMLNEGINLKNCQIGIYANLNASETIIKQRLGRILRHKNPVIIIPYYINSREEELIEKMRENYNPELIKIITEHEIKTLKL